MALQKELMSFKPFLKREILTLKAVDPDNGVTNRLSCVFQVRSAISPNVNLAYPIQEHEIK